MKMHFFYSAILALLFSIVSVSVSAQESEVISLSDTIVGNQEQPTVLYIVPWKPAEDNTILYLPLSPRAMENLFGHVERVEHKREVEFLEELDTE